MATFQYYSSTGSTHEDLGDLVTNISPTDTPFLTRVQKTKARSRVHLFAQDSLGARTAATPRYEGFAFTSDTLSGRVRQTNYVEILAEQVTVADSLEWMDQVGTRSEFAHQMRKAAKNLANRIENRLWSTSTAVSGASATAPRIKAIMQWITSNVSSSTAVRTLTLALMNGVLQSCWSEGGSPELLFCGGARKVNLVDLVSTSYGQRQVPAGGGGKIAQYVDVYQGDFGTQQVVLSRDIATDSFAIIELGRWALAWGARPKMVPIQKDGYRRNAMLVAEYTVESRAQNANGKIEDISG